jgi:uncharacterized repeat protein (TIGR03803 family)
MTTGTERPRHINLPLRRFGLGGAFFLGIELLFLFASPFVHAQTFTVLHRFRGKGDGENPSRGLVLDLHGNLYGTTPQGGAFNYGTVFRIDSHAKETIAHSFWGGDGLQPYSTLIADGAGNLYGTTYNGGTWEGGACLHGCGTVFELDSKGRETVLYPFTGGTDGTEPHDGVVRDKSGNIYGTTSSGGNTRCACGVIFKVNKKGQETVVHAFAGYPDGDSPSGGLIPDGAGNFYGATVYGGTLNKGAIFKVNPYGNVTIVYSFTGKADGTEPEGPLVLDTAGNLFGVAGGGDSSCQCGVVFKIDSSGILTVLYTFTGGADGNDPAGGLTHDSAGNLYGATYEGGSTGCYDGYGCGIIFKVDVNGSFSVIYALKGGPAGAYPNGFLMMDSSNNLYGTTSEGGDSQCGYQGSGCGVVFRLGP